MGKNYSGEVEMIKFSQQVAVIRDVLSKGELGEYIYKNMFSVYGIVIVFDCVREIHHSRYTLIEMVDAKGKRLDLGDIMYYYLACIIICVKKGEYT